MTKKELKNNIATKLCYLIDYEDDDREVWRIATEMAELIMEDFEGYIESQGKMVKSDG